MGEATGTSGFTYSKKMVSSLKFTAAMRPTARPRHDFDVATHSTSRAMNVGVEGVEGGVTGADPGDHSCASVEGVHEDALEERLAMVESAYWSGMYLWTTRTMRLNIDI